jgi:hypothetical protein
MVALVACSVPEKAPEERTTDVLPTQLPPAEIPTYAKGDRYVYDNPREVWTVVALKDGLVTWESSLGETRTTMFDPLLPPVKWRKSNSSGGSRQILEWSGGLFPLKAGNKLTYKDSVQVEGDAGHALFVWNCYAGNPRRLHVPAGDFATVPVFCRRSDGHKLHTYYAPALHNAASLVLTSPDGTETTRNLVSFEPGKGARVAAPRIESLPGGWSAAAIADWKDDIAGLPRVRPEQVAEANPPVGLAGPTDRSRNADELPPVKAKPERTMLAFHAPKIKVPKLQAPTVVSATVPAKPKPAATGRRYGAHIGSFSTRKGAERAWTILGKKSETLRNAGDYTIVEVDLGAPKGVMYRLLAAPSASKADVRQLCSAVKADIGYCRVLSFRS